MIPVGNSRYTREIPFVTYTLIALNVLLYIWDRNWHLFGQSTVFSDLGMKPKAVLDALFLVNSDKLPLVTIFTAMFMHANFLHLFFNMLFLWTFGENIERALGGPRFALYYIFWGLGAAVAHIVVLSDATTPMVGASGAIGGILGCYLLLFPAHRITIVIPPIFWPVEMSAWILLGLWFAWQIFFPQQGVANWAHVGGFVTGMLTVLIAGGREQVLKGKEFLEDDE